jgi:hypothetical protein
MGFEVKEEDVQPNPVNRQMILDQLAQGVITAEEAAKQLAGS